jgi:hypothetical protein
MGRSRSCACAYINEYEEKHEGSQYNFAQGRKCDFLCILDPSDINLGVKSVVYHFGVSRLFVLGPKIK